MDVKLYNVTLSNKACIFDSEYDFFNVEDALKWASNRGGNYVIQLENNCSGVDYNCISIAAECEDGVTYFCFYTPCGWQHITPDQIKNMI